MTRDNRSQRVVVRTHGGLGNQIFQILYARLLGQGREPDLIHDINYPHAFGLNTAFAGHSHPGFVGRIVSASRIPKILERAHMSSRGVVTIGNVAFVDGYFQATHFYERFSSAAISSNIHRLRSELQVSAKTIHGSELHHIRLGDFFTDEQSQRDYLSDRLGELPDKSFIITNREDLVKEAIVSPSFRARDLSIVSSATASPDQTLRLMSEYETIVSNDSTLAFWAACLGERRLMTPSPQLNALFAQLKASS